MRMEGSPKHAKSVRKNDILVSMQEKLPEDKSPKKKRRKRVIRFSESMDIIRDALKNGLGTDIVQESLERTLLHDEEQPI